MVRPFSFAVIDGTLPVQADPTALKQHVEKLVVEFSPRDWTSPQLPKAADYIESEFRKLTSETVSISVTPQKFSAEGLEFMNIVAQFGDQHDSPVVVGAHYDVFGELPGADDNASGVAGLLEIGRLLAHTAVKVPVTLVAYTLEEPPIWATESMGSVVHARSLKEQGITIRHMISLEMIGYFSDQENSQKFPFGFMRYFYPTTGNFITIVDSLAAGPTTIRMKRAFQRYTDLPAVSVNAPALVPGIGLSDHASYWAEGFRAVMVTDTAFYRNTAYHTPNDTPDRLDYTRMAKVVDGVYGYLTQLTN